MGYFKMDFLKLIFTCKSECSLVTNSALRNFKGSLLCILSRLYRNLDPDFLL